jgi:hypothetical protein
MDGQIQDVTIEAQGASNVLCYMQNSDFSFRFYPPQTLKISKSSDPYTIRCLAPGNREKTMVVAPKINDNTYYNAANLGVGAVIDHASSAMYELPDKIVISFEGMQPTAYDQPVYNAFFDQNPHLKGVEEFRPGQPALMRDVGKETNALKMRETSGSSVPSPVIFGSSDPLGDAKDGISPSSAVGVETLESVTVAPPPVPAGSQGMSADSLTRSMNPQIFGGSSTPAASGAPVPINPQ